MKKFLLYFGLFLIILAIVLRSLIFNISSNLIDWRDYPYYAWVINQNINHFVSLDFTNIFNQNVYYPNKNVIFLSDTLFPQSILGLIFRVITNNPVTIINLTLILSILLNYVSAYLLWKNIFKDELLGFLGSISTVFSAYTYNQFGHFQMISFWPMLMAIHFLVNKKGGKRKTNAIIIGLFLSIQFLASVYLAYFLITTIAIYLVIDLWKNKNINKVLSQGLLIILTFVLTSGIFLQGYIDIKNKYNIQRDYGEYVVYSADMTDYIFPRKSGIFYENSLIQKWNSFNKHFSGATAYFPGFILSVTTVLGLISINNREDRFSIAFKKGQLRFFFLSLIIIGFTFSLGPRINFNGNYSEIPLPYALFLKFIPLLKEIRAPSRWSILFYIGITYFSLSWLKERRNKIIFFVVSILLITETIPTDISSSSQEYLTTNDSYLIDLCSKKNTVILEIPVTHFDVSGGIIEGLSYITKRQLASLVNNCYLVNGYSSYDFPHLRTLNNDINNSLISGSDRDFFQTVKDSGADIISFHRKHMTEDSQYGLESVIPSLVNTTELTKIDKDVYIINKLLTD